MDSGITVALIGAVATITAAVVTAILQRPREKRRTPPEPESPEPSRRVGRAVPAKPAAPGPPVASTHEPEPAPASGEEVEDAVPLPDGGKSARQSSAAEDCVAVPCPVCGNKLGVVPRQWFKKLRCRSCQSLFRPSPVPGTSVVVARGGGAG